MSSSVTLIPATIATVPNARGDIARGFKLARRWQQQGKWREAEEVYRSILTVESKHFGSLCGLGAVYKQQGRRKEAVALFRRAAATAPDSPDIQTDLGVILANLNQPEEAVTCFEKALSGVMPQACNKDVAGNPEAQAGQMVVHGSIVSRWRRHTHERGPLLEVIEIAVAKAGARSRPMASNHA